MGGLILLSFLLVVLVIIIRPIVAFPAGLLVQLFNFLLPNHFFGHTKAIFLL